MLNPIVLQLGARYISRQLLQSVLFVVGVALGVAVVVAIDLANHSANQAFKLSAESVTGNTTHQIIGGPGGLPTSLYRELRIGLGLRDSAPIVSGFVRAREAGSQPLRLLGVDPFAEPPFRNYLSTIEVEGADQDSFVALNHFMVEPFTVLISDSLSRRFDLAPGDLITLRPGVEQVEVRIAGLLRSDDQVSQQALDDLLLADIATAQEIIGSPGRISRIDLILPDDYPEERILELLPEGASLMSARDESDALEQMTAAFAINLQALSLLAVIVGVFLVYNTVTFSVVRRRPVIGILRSLGATKTQVFAFILGEAFILGVIGTALGLGTGIIFGRATVNIVSRTINDLYFAVNVQGLAVDPLILVKGAALGLLASIGAAIPPSYDATKTFPAGSMRRSQYEQQARRLVPIITAVAILSCFIGWLLLQVPIDNLMLGFLALFAIIFGGALFTPLLLVGGMRLVTPLTTRMFGILGRMAPRAIVRSLSRTSVAVTALTIAVSVIVGVSVMIGSFRSTVANWLDTTLGADIYISPPQLTANLATVEMEPEVRTLLASVEGARSVSASHNVRVQSPDYPDLPPVNLLAVDYDISSGKRQFAWNLFGPNWQEALDQGMVMVSEPFAYRRGITPENNTIALLTDHGRQDFTIFGVYFDYSTDQGTLYMGRETYDRYFDDPFISSVGVFVEDGVAVEEVMDRIRRNALAGYDLTIQSNRALREGVFEVFDRTFTITVALRLLATIVAFIGILSALIALQLERTREHGVMRANGMTPRQLWNYTLLQTGLMGAVAGALALPIGIVLAVVLVFVINARSFGWTMQFLLLPGDLLEAFVIAVIAALLAGIYPAWRLARLQPAEALRAE